MAEAILRGSPYAHFPNGWPLIIAAVEGILGSGPHLVPALLLLNVLASTATVFGTYCLGAQVTTRRLALIAAAIIAVWPDQLNGARQLLSEVPSGVFVTFGVVTLLAARSFSSGILFSAAALTRATLLPVAPVDAIVLIFARKKRLAASLLAGFAVGLGIHELLTRTGLIRDPGIFAEDVMIAIGGTSTTGIDFAPKWVTARELSHPIATYVQFAAAHPAEFLWQRTSSIWELWGPWPVASVSDLGEPRSALARALIALRFPALVLAAISVWKWRKSTEVWLVASPIVTLTIAHAFFYSFPRYTFPVEPALIVLATLGAASFVSRYPSLPGRG